MRIAFDASALRPYRTGVGYYTEHLLRHVAAAMRPEDDLIVLSNRAVDMNRSLPPGTRVVVDTPTLPRIAWMQLRAPAALKAVGADVVHFTNGMMPLVQAVPAVVTIHDMSLRLLPRCHPTRRVVLNRPLMDQAARRAAAIITVSESAKRDIVKSYGLDGSRVHVVHEAAAPEFAPVADVSVLAAIRRKYRLGPRVILYVGTIEPRKHLADLIEAFERCRRRGDLEHQLVCVGPYGWLSDTTMSRSWTSDAVTFTGYVPHGDLPALYSAAEMFVYPSIYEGFGLPVVEAMACGTPVVAGPATAISEIGANAVEQVDRIDPDALGDAIVRLARDARRRESLREAGLARAGQFSWSSAAVRSLEIYRSVATTASHRRTRPSAPDTHRRRVQPVDVLFGQAYFLRFDPKLWKAQQPYPPLGALYVAACVRERGFSVSLFDAMLADSEREWADALDRCAPKYAVLCEDSFNYLSKMCLSRMRRAALTMIAAARERGIPVVVSGSDASDHPAIYLDGGAHIVVTGEADFAIPEVLDALSGRTSLTLDGVRGVCYRDDEGRVVRTPPREFVRDLDALPLPARDLVDFDRYRSVWQSHHGYFSTNVVTTRGCPFHCNWCAKPIYGQRYAARSPACVAGEFALLKRTCRPDHIWITDDIFGLKPGWIERFADEIQKRDAAIPFKCLLRADQVAAGVASALHQAGCQTVWLGTESGSQRVLDAMEKGTRVEQIETATARLHAAGIEVGFFLQFGYPGETVEDIGKTRDLVKRCGPDDIGISVSYPLPGTAFHTRVGEQLGLKQNWVDSSDLDIMYHAAYVPDFYRALHALVHAEFRARRAASELRAACRTPLQLRPRHARSALEFVRNRIAGSIHTLRVNRLARVPTPHPSVAPLAVLTPQAAAIPAEQPR
jgi:glycosyltransferase involved in cell wall biosynthesis/radical SAM superfamily enzyme YgiQ (UPF0313 family)